MRRPRFYPSKNEDAAYLCVFLFFLVRFSLWENYHKDEEHYDHRNAAYDNGLYQAEDARSETIYYHVLKKICKPARYKRYRHPCDKVPYKLKRHVAV